MKNIDKKPVAITLPKSLNTLEVNVVIWLQSAGGIAKVNALAERAGLTPDQMGYVLRSMRRRKVLELVVENGEDAAQLDAGIQGAMRVIPKQ